MTKDNSMTANTGDDGPSEGSFKRSKHDKSSIDDLSRMSYMDVSRIDEDN